METWQRLCLAFKGLSFFSLSRADIRATVVAYGRLRNDHVSLNVASARWTPALQLLSPLTEVELSYLEDLSAVNLTHLDAHTTRKAALYFTVYPAVFSFLLTKLPAIATPLKLRADSFLVVYLLVLCVGALMFLNFYTAKWQAMEIATCVKVALARHKLRSAQLASRR